jgi:hypothetical protein
LSIKNRLPTLSKGLTVRFEKNDNTNRGSFKHMGFSLKKKKTEKFTQDEGEN